MIINFNYLEVVQDTIRTVQRRLKMLEQGVPFEDFTSQLIDFCLLLSYDCPECPLEYNGLCNKYRKSNKTKGENMHQILLSIEDALQKEEEKLLNG